MAPIFWPRIHNSKDELQAYMLQLSSFSLSALPTFNPCWTHRFCLLNITGFSHVLSPLQHEGPESAVTIIFLSPTTLAASLTFWSVSCYHLYPYKKNWPGDHASHINVTNSLHNCKLFSTYPCLGEAINLSFLVQFPGSIPSCFHSSRIPSDAQMQKLMHFHPQMFLSPLSGNFASLYLISISNYKSYCS